MSAVVGALAIAGIVGYAALRPAAARAVTPTASTVAATPATGAVVETVAKPPAIVKIRINTEPDGATVIDQRQVHLTALIAGKSDEELEALLAGMMAQGKALTA